MNGCKRIYQENHKPRKTRKVFWILDKVGFKTKSVTRDKEGYFIMIKGNIHS